MKDQLNRGAGNMSTIPMTENRLFQPQDIENLLSIISNEGLEGYLRQSATEQLTSILQDSRFNHLLSDPAGTLSVSPKSRGSQGLSRGLLRLVRIDIAMTTLRSRVGPLYKSCIVGLAGLLGLPKRV